MSGDVLGQTECPESLDGHFTMLWCDVPTMID